MTDDDVYDKEWVVAECGCTKGCWCSLVATVDYDQSLSRKKVKIEEIDKNDKQCIIGSGAVNHKEAAHIVMCHNFYLQKSRMIEDGREKEREEIPPTQAHA